MLFGTKPNFSNLQMFGCCVWVKPSGSRRGKLSNHARKGLLLGYLPATLKNILWYDVETHQVKIAFHVRFDEGMNDLPHSAIPLNVQHLHRVCDGVSLPPEPSKVSVTSFGFPALLSVLKMTKPSRSLVLIPLLALTCAPILAPIGSISLRSTQFQC
jgi:hypothetical protein